jgi:hypothetical protein
LLDFGSLRGANKADQSTAYPQPRQIDIAPTEGTMNDARKDALRAGF